MTLGITKMLKAFGVDIRPEHIEAVEKIVPEIPRRVDQLITWVNETDERLRHIERRQTEILILLERYINGAGNSGANGNGAGHPTGAGTTDGTNGSGTNPGAN